MVGKEIRNMRKGIKKLAVILIFSGLSLTGRASFAAALNALDHLRGYGVGGTVANPDFTVKGFSVFGSTYVLTHISTTTGNVVINGQLEVSSDVYVVKSATFTDNVYLNQNSLYISGGATNQLLKKDPGGWLTWTDISFIYDNLGNHIATTTLNMAGNSIINAASGTFSQGITASSFTASNASLGVDTAKLRFTNDNIIVSSASAAQYGGIYVSTNIYLPAGAQYFGDAYSLTGVSLRYYVTRTLKFLGNTVDIGSFITSGGSHSLYISVSVSGSWSASKQYAIPISQGMTNGDWNDVLAISSVVNDPSNDFVLEINVLGPMAQLRLRRTAGNADGNAVISLEQLGPVADVFTPSTNTGSDVPNPLLSVTPLTQIGGKVGIGTGNPAAMLHMSSGTLLIDGNAANSIIAGGRVGIGTTNPTEALYVVGNATFTQTATANTFNAVGTGYNMNGTVVIDSLRGVYAKTLTVEQTANISTLTVTGSDFSVGGSTLVVKAGLVGIGTTSPLNTLHVQGVNNGSAGIYINDATPSATANTLYSVGGNLYWNASLVGVFGGTTLTGGGSVNYLPKWTGATALGTSVLFENAGKIGIGTTSPAQTFDIYGALALSGVAALEQSGGYLRINQSNQFSNGIYTGTSGLRIGGATGLIVGSSGADGQIALVPNGADNIRRITLDGGTGNAYFSGKGGIGTTSPNAKLDVAGNELRVGPVSSPASYSQTLTDTHSAYLVTDKSLTASDASIMLRDQGNARSQIGLIGDNNIHFKTATGSYGAEIFTDRLLINSNGSVDALGGPLRSYATSGAPKIIAGTSDGTNGAGLELSYDFTAVLSKITSVAHGSPGSYSDLVMEGNNLRFQTGTTSVSERVRIDSSGKVGIGISAPGEVLDVNGNISVSGNLIFKTTATINSLGLSYPVIIDAMGIQLNANGGGNVGIGTTNPGATLDVNGVVNSATGYRFAGGAANGYYLRGNGTNFVSSALQAGDVALAIGAVPALTLGTSNASGSANTFVRTDATILAFDSSLPAALGTAASGTATVAARRDHVHPAADLAGASTTGILPLSRGGTNRSTTATANRYLIGYGSYWGPSTGSASGTGICPANTWAFMLKSDAAPTCTQPAFSNLSGTTTLAQLPFSTTANQLIGTNDSGTGEEFKTLSTGTVGTDFNIALHTANTITFNLPDASASARGVVNTGSQIFAGPKTFTGGITDTYAGATALTMSGNGSGIDFTGSGPNQIITNSGANLALMPGGTGAVGIGTTSPASGTLLDVNGVVNAATGYRAGGVVAAGGNYLRGNGTNFVSNTIQVSDLPSALFAAPTQTADLSAHSGTAITAMRSDAAPALSQAIIPTWTGTHNFSNGTYSAVFTGGNVGIGTATPNTYKLEVIGTINASSGLYEGSTAIYNKYVHTYVYTRVCIAGSDCVPPSCDSGDSDYTNPCTYGGGVAYCERVCTKTLS